MATAGSLTAVSKKDGGSNTQPDATTKHLELANSVMKTGTGGKFTASSSGKATIFSTTHLGNPVSAAPATFYVKATTWNACAGL